MRRQSVAKARLPSECVVLLFLLSAGLACLLVYVLPGSSGDGSTRLGVRMTILAVGLGVGGVVRLIWLLVRSEFAPAVNEEKVI
jgi:hypothetical protein